MSNQTGVRKPRTAHPTKLPGIPKPPADCSGSLRQYLTSVTEALEVRLGRKGDPRDAAVTFRDLIESGLAVEVYYGGGNSSGGNVGPPNPDGPGVPGIQDPTAPTGFRGSGAMYNISLWWNAARYEYGGHSYTEIWRAGPIVDANGDIVEGQEPTLDDAIEIGTSVGTTYVDPVGSGKTFYYWIRHVNINGDKGPWADPYPRGLQASTQPDIELLLELLDGLIGEDQLTQDLQDQIALIDELEGFTGYYESWRVDGDLVTRINAISSSSDGNQIIIEELSEVVDGLKGQYTVKIQTNTAGGGKYVSGFGLASEPVNGVPTSRFIISADQFAVIEPATYNLSDSQALNDNSLDPYTPFQILTTEREYDGITIPRGVYIKEAYMGKARILELIAGSVVADFMESTVAMSAPSIFGGTINIGTIVKPDSSPRSWYVSGSQRVGNFSVDAIGVMHAHSAKLFGVTIYDEEDGVVLLDSGGMGVSTGGNMLINGELLHPETITNDPAAYAGAPFVDSNGSSLKGWNRGTIWNGSSYFAAGTSQCFQLLSGSEIYSDYVPVMAPHSDGTRPLYLTADLTRNATGGNYHFRVAYYNYAKNFLGSQYVYGSSVQEWGNGEDEYPTRASGRGQFSTVFDSFKDNRIAYIRVIVRVDSISGYMNLYSVYLGVSPMEISPSYARTYIRDLSVQTLMIEDEAVIVSSAVSASDGYAGKNIDPKSWTASAIKTPAITWNHQDGRPSALFIQASAVMAPIVGSSSDEWRTHGFRIQAARNSGFTSGATYSPQVTFQARERNPVPVSVGWKFPITDSTPPPYYFRLFVYAYNANSNSHKILVGDSIIVHGVKK